MSSLRSPRALAALTLLSLLLAACGGAPAAPSAPAASEAPAAPAAATEAPAAATEAPAATGGSELVVGISGDIVAVDPAFAYDFTANQVVCQISEGLLKLKDGKTVEPNLAESVETSKDGLVWTYKLRKGVTFQDGSPMTADDVIFSLERTRDPKTASYVGWMFGNVDKIEKSGDDAVKITLKQPDAFWQYVPTTTAGNVISKAYYEKHKDKFGKPEGGLLGTGPFKFVSWETGSQIVVQKYDNYWNKANGGPYLDKITFKVIPEATTRVAGLQSGELGMMLSEGIPPDQIPIVQQMPDVALTFSGSYLSDWIAFNTQRPPFDNQKLRQALNYAVDKSQVTKALWGDAATIAGSVPVGPDLWTFGADAFKAAYEKLPKYEKDMAKAKQLLQESGVADKLNGKVITTDENPVRLGQALALQAAVKELGYDVQIEKIPYAELISRSFSGARDYDLIVSSWGADFPDPAGNLLPTFHSRNAGDGGSNFGNFKNPELDKILDQQQSETDPAKRVELMNQALTLIADQSPWIVFDYPKQILALNKAYSGYAITPLWYWDAYGTNLKKVQ